MPTDLNAEILEAATAPKSTDVDGINTQERDLRELIDADKHVAEKTAANRYRHGVRFAQLSPPGTV